jgi:hypothetical protein
METSSGTDNFLDEIQGEGVPKSEGVNRVKLLQGGNPEVKPQKQQYVIGAENHIGDYYFKGREPAFVSGETGFEFIPLDIQHSWDEWVLADSGSNVVIHHPAKPPGMQGDLLNGNEVNYTRHLFLALAGDLNDVWVYAMKGTALTPLDRELVQPLNRAFATRSDGKTVRLPIYGAAARAGHKYRETAQNDWWVPSFRIISAYPERPDFEVMQAARYARRALPRIGPSIFEQQKGLVGADRIAVLPPQGVTPRLQGTAPRANAEFTAKAEGEGAGMRPFAPIEAFDEDISS